jgi:hypothetical protein
MRADKKEGKCSIVFSLLFKASRSVSHPSSYLSHCRETMPNDHEQTPLLSGSIAAEPPPRPFDENDHNLTKFRKAVGINIDVDGTGADLEAARKGARGLYKQIIATQTWRSRQYRLVEVLFYLALGTQIAIGATLTALGPISKLHSKAITILGVVNTTMAGVLALLKGQGLPDRLRKDEFEMRKVQDFIEETETRLVVGGEGTLDTEELDELLQQVFAKYNAARDTAEMNRPDSYGHQPEAAVQRNKYKGSFGVGRNIVAGDGNGKKKLTGGLGQNGS